MNRQKIAISLLACAASLLGIAAADSDPLAIVAKHQAVFTAPPKKVPTNMMVDGPILGNGDLGVAMGGAPERQVFHLSKNDFWTRTPSNAKIITIGSLVLEIPAMAGASYRQEQDLALAEVRGTFSKGEVTLRTRSRVDANANLLVTELACEGGALAVSVCQTAGEASAVPESIVAGGMLNMGREQEGGGRWYFHGETSGITVSDKVHDGQPVGKPDTPISFDGKSTWKEMAAPAVTGSVSVSGWIKIATTGEANFLVSNGEWRKAYSLGLSGGCLRWAINGTYIQTEQPLERGRWQYVAATYDGRRMQVFIDGKLGAAIGSADGEGLLSFTRRADNLPGSSRQVAVATRVMGGGADKLTLRPGKPSVIVTAIHSDLDMPEFSKTAPAVVRELAPQELNALEKRHREWWAEFWAKSFIEIPDKQIERHWYSALYAMGSCSRPGEVAPGLWGNWITTDKPLFNGDYHLNYNAQAPFFLTYGTNHADLSLPFYQVIRDAAPNGRELARRRGWKGIHFSLAHGPWGLLAYHLDADFGQRSDAALAAQNFIWYWRYTRDTEWLKKDAYPYLREVAEFWEHYLKFEDGRYVIHQDAIQEDSGNNMNPLLSLGLVRSLFATMIETSGELGVDADKRGKWQDILDKLSPFALQERNGKTVFRYTEKGTDWWENNILGIIHVFPTGVLGLDSDPKLLEIARNTAADMARWHDGNGFWAWYSACARLGMDPHLILEKLHEECTQYAAPNGLIHHPGGGIENCTGLLAVNEMLLQSHEGVLRFFPCWPRELDARFGTLRADGAFLVSAELKSGAVSGVSILSEKGRDCTVVNPWPERNARVTRNGSPAEIVGGDRFTLKTKLGEILILESL